jgi:hypothetical protein
MAKNVQLTIDIKGNDSVGKAAEATKSLKTQLKELKAELASGNLTGKAFDEAAARAGKLQDSIADVNQRVKNLASDTGKLEGFIDVATGITGGFAAAQGAMALFGSENEDVQKQLVKIQGAVALLNGVQQVANTLNKDSAAMTQLQSIRLKVLSASQAAYTFVLGASTGAMKIFRIALAATGVGALVVGVGLLIANFDKVKKVVLNFIPALANIGELFTKVKNAVMDFVGISSEAERQEEKAAKQRAVRSQQLKNEVELMEANGASARDLYLAKRKLLFNDLETLKIAAFKEGATQDEIKAYNELVQAIRVLDAEESTRIKEGAQKTKDANTEAAKKRKEETDKKKEEAKKEAEELKKILDEETEAKRLRGKSAFELELMELQKEAERKQELFKNDLEAQKLIRENFQKDADALDAKYKKEEAEKKKESDKLLKELIEQRRVDDLSVRDKELNDISEKYAKEAELAKGQATLLAQIQTDKDNALREKKLQFDAEDAALQQEADNVRIEQIANTAAQAGQLISQLAGKNKAAALTALALEKGAAIANVIVSTQREIAAYRANPTWSLLPDGGAAIKATNIIAAKVRAGISIASISAAGLSGAKNISGGGNGGGSVQPPNIRGSQTSNEPTSQQPTKVFVTETDIRSVTRKVDGIFTQATII